MSTAEALNLDQAVEKFMAPMESASEDAELDSAVEAITEEETDEVDSEVDTSDYDDAEDESEAEYDDEEDTDEESTESDDEPDQVEPEETFTVKVDGEEVSVTLEDLKRSYSGQGKIQKGMQEAAEMRKQAQAMQEQAAVIANQIVAMHQQVQQQGFMAPPQEPSREMFDSDPIGYMEAKMDYDQQVQQYQAQQQQLAQAQRFQQYQTQAQQEQMLQRELSILREKIPELGDAEKATKFGEDIVKYGAEYGYSREELSSVMDHRALMIMRDAMRYRQSQAKRSQNEKKAQGARPVIKPQAKKTQNPKRKAEKQAKANLKKTGSIEAALAALGIE